MAARKAVPKKQARGARKKAVPSWTIRGVSEETKAEVTRAAKEQGIAIGQWVDEALSAATKAGPGDQILSSLHDLKERAEPTFDQLRSRTDETLERWRAGLIEQVGSAVESIQRLQQQLLGKEAEEEKAPPLALTNQSKDNPASKVASRPRTAKAKSARKRSAPASRARRQP